MLLNFYFQKPWWKHRGVSVYHEAWWHGSRYGQAPPEVSVAHYAPNGVAATPQVLRDALTHGCPKKPWGFIPGGVSRVEVKKQYEFSWNIFRFRNSKGGLLNNWLKIMLSK